MLLHRRATLQELLALAPLVVGCACRANDHGPAAHEMAASPVDAAPWTPFVRVEAAGETFRLATWAFPVRATSFDLVDLGMRGSLTQALGATGQLAVNAGFFDPGGRPIGLAVSGGKELSKFSSTLSGGVFFVSDAVAHISATEEFDPRTPLTFAVQCRPRLVVHGKLNIKSDDGQRAERTALCIRDGGETVDVVLAEPSPGGPGPSLFALGTALAEQQHCEDALNLDGGPSTGVAYRVPTAIPSTPQVVAPRGPLRYAITLR
jgi:hypothetical protein